MGESLSSSHRVGPNAAAAERIGLVYCSGGTLIDRLKIESLKYWTMLPNSKTLTLFLGNLRRPMFQQKSPTCNKLHKNCSNCCKKIKNLNYIQKYNWCLNWGSICIQYAECRGGRRENKGNYLLRHEYEVNKCGPVRQQRGKQDGG